MSLLLAIFMLFSNAFAVEFNAVFIVSTTSCYVYNDSSFSSEKLQKDGQDLILYHGDKVIYKSENDDFYYVAIDDETKGYVYKYYLTSDNSSISVYPTFNATIRQECEVFDIDGNSTGYHAEKGQRVFLYAGFKSREKYNPVQIVLDNEVYNGYIETKYIRPDGVSATLIVAISTIVSVVIVTLSLVFIKKQRKHKKKKLGSKSWIEKFLLVK